MTRVCVVVALLVSGLLVDRAAGAGSSATFVAPYRAVSCGSAAPAACAEIGAPLKASFSSSCLHGPLSPSVATGTGWLDHASYFLGYQERIGSAALKWTVSWPYTTAAPYRGRGSGTWSASGLPACATATKGRVTIAWSRRGSELVARFVFAGLP
jgi:hypothetical protein